MFDRKKVEEIKNTYKTGMRIRLIKMDDIQAPPIGTMGTVIGVDDIGSILVRWDNGSSLHVLVDEDALEIHKELPKIINVKKIQGIFKKMFAYQ